MTNRHRSTKSWQVMGETFDLSTRFKVVDYLGSGAYGMVCAVHDYQENELVAIKKCKKIFQSRTLAKRTLREMRLLRHFNHENIIRLKTILPPVDERFYTDLYLVFDVMDTDLAQIIRSPQPLKEQHTQYFTYQLLRALEYLHSKSIVHRDIKPRNILVNADCTLKVADFGLARLYRNDGPESVTAITDYVTTRWYRAPEVIVGWSSYTAAIDMWAVGCIMAELLSRSPLFPGENTMKQLGLIIRLIGSPSEAFVLRSTKSMFRQYMLSMMHRRPVALGPLLPTASADAVDLITRLLDYDPVMRPTATASLCHPFIARMSNTLSPPVCSPMCIGPEEFEFDTRKLTIDDLRAEIGHEIDYYNQVPPSMSAVPGADSGAPEETVEQRLGLTEAEEEEAQLLEAALLEGGEVGGEEAEAQVELPAVAHEAPPIQEPHLPWNTGEGKGKTAVSLSAPVPASASTSTSTRTRARRALNDITPDMVEVTTPVPSDSGPRTNPPRPKMTNVHSAQKQQQERDEQEVIDGVAALLHGTSEDSDDVSALIWRDAQRRGEVPVSSQKAVPGEQADVDIESGGARPAGLVHRRGASGASAYSAASTSSSSRRLHNSSSGRPRTHTAERATEEAAALASSYFTCMCEHQEQEQVQGDRQAPARTHRASADEEEGKVGMDEYEEVRGEDVESAGERRLPPGHRRGGAGGAGSRKDWGSTLASCTVS